MKRVLITGDIHGQPNRIHETVAQIDNPSSEDVIIIAGDAGFEYQDHIMGAAKREAKKFPGTWIVLRGNHDSCYWKMHTDWDAEKQQYYPHHGWAITEDNMYLYQKKYPNIWYIIDGGGIYNIGDYNILFVPGAYSVDKWYRLRNHYPWNPMEQLTLDEQKELELITIEWLNLDFDIDFVVGHTFPLKMQRYYQDLFLSGLDQTTVDKTTEWWLNDIADIYEKLPSFKQYFGGHFHDDRVLTDKYTMLYHNVENLADYVKE